MSRWMLDAACVLLLRWSEVLEKKKIVKVMVKVRSGFSLFVDVDCCLDILILERTREGRNDNNREERGRNSHFVVILYTYLVAVRYKSSVFFEFFVSVLDKTTTLTLFSVLAYR